MVRAQQRACQGLFHRLKVLQIVIAAAIPIVAGADASAWITGSLGASIVVFEGFQQLFQFQQNWLGYRATAEALKHQKFLYLARAGRYRDAPAPDARLAEHVEAWCRRSTPHGRPRRRKPVPGSARRVSGSRPATDGQPQSHLLDVRRCGCSGGTAPVHFARGQSGSRARSAAAARASWPPSASASATAASRPQQPHPPHQPPQLRLPLRRPLIALVYLCCTGVTIELPG